MIVTEEHAKPPRWTWREGYVLALAPAIGLFCVNRYEAGRFAYLGLPSELIDLPISRLISGGTAVVLLDIGLLFSVLHIRNLLNAESGWRRWVGSALLLVVMFGVPFFDAVHYG